MSGLILPGAVDSSPWGKLQPYAGVTDGTTFLWDAGLAPLSGVPTPSNNMGMVNLMADRGAEIYGVSEADMSWAIISALGSFAAGEITEKGAVHIASTQAGSQNAAAYWNAGLSSAAEQAFLNNTDAGEDWAVLNTVWARVTRAGITSGNTAPQAYILLVSALSATVNFHSYATFTGQFAAGGPIMQGGNGQALAGLNTPGVAGVASQGWTGTKPAQANFLTALASVGAYGPWNTTNYNKAPSIAVYRIQQDIGQHIEGVDAVGVKLRNQLTSLNDLLAHDFAAGGRFADDVWTPPATLMP